MIQRNDFDIIMSVNQSICQSANLPICQSANLSICALQVRKTESSLKRLKKARPGEEAPGACVREKNAWEQPWELTVTTLNN